MKLSLEPGNQKILIEILMALAHWFPDNYDQIKDLIHQVKKKGIQICVDPLKTDRTRSQEKYYRKWIREFAKSTGNTPDELHDIMLGICFGRETVQTKFGVKQRPLLRSGDQTKETSGSHLWLDATLRTAASAGFYAIPGTGTVLGGFIGGITASANYEGTTTTRETVPRFTSKSVH